MLFHWKVLRIIYSKYSIILFVLCIIFIYLLQMKMLLNIFDPYMKSIKINDYEDPKEYLINTPGCKIPNFYVMPPNIKKYFTPPAKYPKCKKGKRPLFDFTTESVYLIEDALEDYNIKGLHDITCCYQYFKRRNPINNETGENEKIIKFSNECIIFSDFFLVDPKQDFVKIICNKTQSHKIVYEDYFHFISQLKHSQLHPPTRTKQNKNKQKLNMIILGLDGVSRLNFHRLMPKTAVFFNILSGYEFLGFNVIGDGSVSNQYPVISGYKLYKLKETCMPYTSNYADACDFIWNKYKKAGYVTAFGEDDSRRGLFASVRRGFFKQPTDYFYNQFDSLAQSRIYNRYGYVDCLGSRPSHEVLLKYVENFVLTMKGKEYNFFSYFWVTGLTHDSVKSPIIGDDRVSDILINFHKKGILNETVLIFMSDHGTRFGPFRETHQGSFEERLPILNILLPDWYKKMYPEMVNNLKINTERLITPYDLHETLLDFLNPLKRDVDDFTKFGISLFRTIPEDRTCEDVTIPEHFCTCKQSHPVGVNDFSVIQVVNYVIEYLNGMLKKYPQCCQLKLSAIKTAREIMNYEVELESHIIGRDYRVIFQTTPGDAIFEATVRKKHHNNGTIDYTVSDSISRINIYGKQSYCVNNNWMKYYCYCKVQQK